MCGLIASFSELAKLPNQNLLTSINLWWTDVEHPSALSNAVSRIYATNSLFAFGQTDSNGMLLVVLSYLLRSISSQLG
jgi:hypothetical protein